MSAAFHTPALQTRRLVPAGVRRFVEEVLTVLSVLLNPRGVMAEVEAMQALLKRADRVEASDPELAARLRRKAARIGL
ncbi:MAG TPA: hypothetical protein VFQ16_13035 [Burkholderiaceae bacterium]|nr:hypothetical protein [Burkholderiaceae bacterium]